jgi:hypothetical protein
MLVTVVVVVECESPQQNRPDSGIAAVIADIDLQTGMPSTKKWQCSRQVGPIELVAKRRQPYMSPRISLRSLARSARS